MLISNIPNDLLNEASLKELFNTLPGSVERIWINHDTKDLPDLVEDRDDLLDKLETACTDILKTANKLDHQRLKKNQLRPAGVDSGSSISDDSERGLTVAKFDQYIPRKKQPTHRVGLWGLIGKKVNTIDHALQEIPRMNVEIDHLRKKISGSNYTNSAFILFSSQISAHLANQTLVHHYPLACNIKVTDISPADVVWPNVNSHFGLLNRNLRLLTSYSVTAGLMILWVVPVTFIGSLSSISGVCKTWSFLTWICKLPDAAIGIIQGILPTVLLALLMLALPPILRLLAELEGLTSRREIELSLMKRYTVFQVIYSFLIITIASGLTNSVNALKNIATNPTSVLNSLATTLPGASIFFITFLMLQGFSGGINALLQLPRFVLYYLKYLMFTSTPRQTHTLQTQMPNVQWGTLLPSITLLTIISLAYAVIAPIICGFAVVSFALLYFVYKVSDIHSLST